MTVGLSAERLPGKVLVVDDKFETVDYMIEELAKRGIPVLFWNGEGEPPKSASGVRVLITDLNLTGEADSPDMQYDYTASVLDLIPGPYAVLIVSVNPTSDSPSNLKSAYKRVTDRDIPGFIIPKAFSKEEAKDLDTLVTALNSMLKKRPIFQALLLTEEILDKARDAVVRDIAQEQFEPAVSALIRSIAKETGADSVARELAKLLAHLQTRNVRKMETYDRLKKFLSELVTEKEQDVSTKLRSYILNLRMYYVPDENERPWTGDIYKLPGSTEHKRYAILMTPACDISQDKVTHLTFCYGFPITEAGLKKDNHPIYRRDKKVANYNQARKYLTGKDIPQRFYGLDNYREEANGHEILLLDFQDIHSKEIDKFKNSGWLRTCRLDSPYLEDLLQKFGSHSFRIGTPDTTS